MSHKGTWIARNNFFFAFFITIRKFCVTFVNNFNSTMSENKSVEKEKIVAEQLNGRFAMIGFIAAVGAYLTTGQIIPGFV